MRAISVICTARDSATTLGAVIESIRAQTSPDWEMIIVDDGSRDATAELVRAASNEDKRIQLVESKHIGRGAALNLAAQKARCDLIANVDADDPSHPRRLELSVRTATRAPEYAVIATQTVSLAGKAVPVWPEAPDDAPLREVTRSLVRNNPLNHSSVVFRREAFASVGGYAVDRQSQFDYDLWVRLAAAGRRLAVLEAPLASKRVHAGQSFENRRRIRYVAGNAACQWRAIRSLHGGPKDVALLLSRVAWGLLPGGARQKWGPGLRRRFGL